MNVEVRITKNFKKEVKPLLKKHSSLRTDLLELNNQLIINPTLGTALGSNAYKIRLAIKSKGKGKSGGARIITYLETETIITVDKIEDNLTVVNLMSIYDKGNLENITDKELKELIKHIEY